MDVLEKQTPKDLPSGRFLCYGNEAVGWGALAAGCKAFFGYPITPQNEVPAWFAREYPKRGLVFVQTNSEVSSINMVHGGAATGFRVMTSTSSPGWNLMQEGMSNMANAGIPAVVVLVQRGGPGEGTVRHAQMDYFSVTRGAGGGYHNIVLAPASVQEVCDCVQLAFHLAEKYRNPVIVTFSAVIGQAMEPLEVKTIDFGSIPDREWGPLPSGKDWAVKGRANHEDGKCRIISDSVGLFQFIGYPEVTYLDLLRTLDRKFREMESEVRCDSCQTEDAELVIVAWEYAARVAREALAMARQEGLKVGLVRPITLWPFPRQVIREKAGQGAKFLVVEDSLGQMIEDVRMAAGDKAEIHFLGALARHLPYENGMIFPAPVLAKIRAILGGVPQ